MNNNDSLRQPSPLQDVDDFATGDTVISQKWWFSFACGTQDPHRNCYVVIEGDYATARKEMFRRFGKRWCGQYASAAQIGVEAFSLKEIVS